MKRIKAFKRPALPRVTRSADRYPLWYTKDGMTQAEIQDAYVAQFDARNHLKPCLIRWVSAPAYG